MGVRTSTSPRSVCALTPRPGTTCGSVPLTEMEPDPNLLMSIPERLLRKPAGERPTHIRSFALRRGHVSNAQKRAYEDVLPRVAIGYAAARLDLAAAFGRSAPTVLEIGFGMGETTAAIATARPEVNFLGVEVFAAGIGALCKRIDEQSLANVRIVQHDAVEVLAQPVVRAAAATAKAGST